MREFHFASIGHCQEASAEVSDIVLILSGIVSGFDPAVSCIIVNWSDGMALTFCNPLGDGVCSLIFYLCFS